MVRVRVLLTSSGRRVSLIRAFKRAIAAEADGRVLAADVDPTAPSLIAADAGYTLPAVSSHDYTDRLLELCIKERVSLVVPLIDPELPVVAQAKSRFASVGVVVAVPDPQFVRIANDKLYTYQQFRDLGIPTAATFVPCEAVRAMERGSLRFPVMVKPRGGSAGKQVALCRDDTELEYAVTHTPEPVVQEHLDGAEVTIDVLGDGNGGVLGLVPRKRLKVRAGEVERGVTVDDAPFRKWVQTIVSALRPFGVINLQCFINEQGARFTEINARFGGGYPLADAAGAAFPEMLVDLVRQRRPTPNLGQYRRGLLMTRFDEAFFVDVSDIPGGDKLAGLPGCLLGQDELTVSRPEEPHGC